MMAQQRDYAPWWDDPSAGDGDTPVIRHAPDPNNYHVPDYDMLTKMRGSRVGRFAIIPAANRDGTSKGFNADEAGLVHVDPDAPDGGVIVDPKQLNNGMIGQALAQSYYPHQAFYKLGTPAPMLGYKKGRFYNHQAHGDYDQPDEQPRLNPMMGSNAYVVPKSTHDGRQHGHLTEIPNIVGNGMGPLPMNTLNPYAQEEQRVQPAPSLQSLQSLPQPQGPAPAQPQQAPPPQMQQAPPMNQFPTQYPPQMQAPQQFQQVPQYPQPQQMPPGYNYQPPPQMPGMDPNFQAMMMQQMAAMQQQMVALAQRQPEYEKQATTGMSNNPLPRGAPQGLRNMPVETRQQQRRAVNGYQPAYQGEEDEFDDNTARPINKQVRRAKKSQEIVEEEQGPPRRRPNSFVAREQEEQQQQTVREYNRQRAEDMEPEGVVVGFETLNIEWLDGPIAHKPKKVVYFEIPNAGKHKAYFHDIAENENCIVLTYDTRYETGMQYLPPDCGQTVVKLVVPGTKKSYSVFSMGFHTAFGVFDQILLPKADPGLVDSDEQE